MLQSQWRISSFARAGQINSLASAVMKLFCFSAHDYIPPLTPILDSDKSQKPIRARDRTTLMHLRIHNSN